MRTVASPEGLDRATGRAQPAPPILEYARQPGFRIDDFVETTASGQTSEKRRRLDELTSVLQARESAPWKARTPGGLVGRQAEAAARPCGRVRRTIGGLVVRHVSTLGLSGS